MDGEAPKATARPQKQTYAPGEAISVDFTGFPAYPQDWIEISPASAAEDSYGEYKYLDGKCAGTVQFAALPPGSYEVRGRFNWSEGGMTIRTRAPFTVRSNAVVRPQKATFAEGEPIVVAFEGFPGNAQDWIDLSATGTPDASYGPYKYTEGQAAGTLQFDALAPGTYEIRGRFNNGYDVQARATFTVEPMATPRDLLVSYEAGWVGMDADVVGEWGNGAPDGRPDGHFTLDISINSPYLVRSIGVYISDAQGNRTGGDTWDSRNTGAWMLGVVQNGRQLNQTHVDSLGRYEGYQRFDLFANSNNSFNSGQHFTVTADVGLAEPLTRVVQVTGEAPQAVAFAGTIRTDRPSYTEIDPITVHFTGFPATSDWIAIAPAGAPDDQYAQWFWTDGSSTEGRPAGTPRADGSLSFNPLPPGGYEVRAFADWPAGGTTARARHAFSVAPHVEPRQEPNACGRTLGTGIFDKWQGLGGESGFLGCPTADELDATPSPQGTTGRWAPFAGNSGMIVWHGTGARISHVYEVHGDISVLYASMGGSASWLGFPISDEYEVAGGRRSDFEGGYILWDAGTREAKAYRHGEEPAPPQPPDR